MGKTHQQTRDGQRNYGLLGNVIARVAERYFGSSKTADVKASDKVTTASVAPPSPAQSNAAKAARVSPLKGFKELLRMLWSNFLPDPTFDRAIEALKARDRNFGMDSAEGEGGYITAAQKAMMLSQSK